MSKIELKVGQVWKNRLGHICEITRLTKHPIYRFGDALGYSYTENGVFDVGNVGSPEDLVELIRDVSEPTPEQVEQPTTAQVGGQHYKATGLQPWDVIEKWFTPEQKVGYFWGETLAYLGRLNVTGIVNKGGLQDALKARHTLDQLIAVLQAQEGGAK